MLAVPFVTPAELSGCNAGSGCAATAALSDLIAGSVETIFAASLVGVTGVHRDTLAKTLTHPAIPSIHKNPAPDLFGVVPVGLPFTSYPPEILSEAAYL